MKRLVSILERFREKSSSLRHGKIDQSLKFVPLAERATFDQPKLGSWYPPVLLGPTTVGEFATSSDCLYQVIQVLERLEPDDYVRYLLTYYRAGLERFGDNWYYADIVTVLMASAVLLRPENYLEIGVRRGRSMAVVAAICTDCKIVGIDRWQNTNYAGMPNPGPEFVREELDKLGYEGRLELIVGDSHDVLPSYFMDHPDKFFDLITVDGDHSENGAEQDLRDVLSHLKVGGGLVFDDINHPAHPYLMKVWRDVIESDPRFDTWCFSELGYGVALAIRKTE